MQCKISKCNCSIFTTDGYCEKHKYYSRYDHKYIMDHINKFHIQNINNESSKEAKAKKTLLLLDICPTRESSLLNIQNFI